MLFAIQKKVARNFLIFQVMKTNPSDVFLLQKVDEINRTNRDTGATIEAVLSGIDEVHALDVLNSLNQLKRLGVIEQVNQVRPIAYKVTGNCEGASEEIKHYVSHRVRSV